ncbi:GNAT family N-acetyltransferase [Anaerotruncus sp. DFI.9.16]|uniref:GNAT family N-acetyltransferase n=1 Tax=Anaerotruncus sp. DFI.9.16 TaxID=2965275 RepID=UPI00210B6FC3|nr:GNAT family N-acetyltransferase [Anaerotruncus sp. DFI.9.16]MCQ4894416.1 GNAT family N-acetyltransferase [Anaerotruncus sp. DFI.9.16]
MIRKLTPQDKTDFLTLLDEFYHSPAVLHPVPAHFFERTYEQAVSDSPYVDVFLLEQEGKLAGYGQVSLTWSTEAGGMVVLLEELYLRPEFQGKGLGSAYFSFVSEYYAGKAARFRLEVEPDNEGARRLYGRLGYEELPYVQMVRELGK